VSDATTSKVFENNDLQQNVRWLEAPTHESETTHVSVSKTRLRCGAGFPQRLAVNGDGNRGTGTLAGDDQGTGTLAGVGAGVGLIGQGAGELLELGAGFYRSVLESLSEGVIITDRDSRVLFANRRMEEMTGWTPGELVGRISYEVLAPPELWAAMRRRLEERLAGEEEAYENELVRKDGSRHWIQVRASPYRDSAGTIQGTIGAMSCIQRQKELEQENTRLLDVLAAERGFRTSLGTVRRCGRFWSR
jgi:PAS domain S-box-containing protein